MGDDGGFGRRDTCLATCDDARCGLANGLSRIMGVLLETSAALGQVVELVGYSFEGGANCFGLLLHLSQAHFALSDQTGLSSNALTPTRHSNFSFTNRVLGAVKLAPNELQLSTALSLG